MKGLEKQGMHTTLQPWWHGHFGELGFGFYQQISKGHLFLVTRIFLLKSLEQVRVYSAVHTRRQIKSMSRLYLLLFFWQQWQLWFFLGPLDHTLPLGQAVPLGVPCVEWPCPWPTSTRPRGLHIHNSRTEFSISISDETEYVNQGSFWAPLLSIAQEWCPFLGTKWANPLKAG